MSDRARMNLAAVCATLAAMGIVILALIAHDAVTNHEPPVTLPDCAEDEVLDIAPDGYVADPQKRIYICKHPDNA